MNMNAMALICTIVIIGEAFMSKNLKQFTIHAVLTIIVQQFTGDKFTIRQLRRTYTVVYPTLLNFIIRAVLFVLTIFGLIA